MKKLATTMAAAAAVALTALIATGPANAAPRHNDQAESYAPRHSGPGYYEGLYEYHVDRDDRASSPYQNGGY